MIIRRIVFVIAVLCISNANTAAFNKLATGSAPDPFVLIDSDGKEVESEKLWDQITIVTFMRDSDKYTRKVLDDLSALSELKSARSSAIWVIIVGEMNRRLALEIPENIRKGVLFDTAGTMDRVIGLVVMPSTGVFSSDGRLLAYFPLWRETLLEELDSGLDQSLKGKSIDSVSAVWLHQTKREETMRTVNLLWAAERKDSAMAIAEAQLAVDSTWLEGLLFVGELRLRTANFVKAWDLYEKAMERFQPTPEIYLGMARAAIGLGQFSKAREWLASGRYMTAHPEEFLSLEGELHYQMNEIDSALAKWREGVELLLGKPTEVSGNE